MSVALLDANVVIALTISDHVHHEVAEEWFTRRRGQFATCPITQGALVRLVLRHGGTADQALAALTSLTSHKAHRFWPDDVDFGRVAMTGVVGHRQVTDAYLAALARHQGGKLATFDQALAALHPDVSLVVPAPEG